jgi:dUTPase
MIDTSKEAVERLAREHEAQAAMLRRAAEVMPDAHGSAICAAARQTHEDTAATLRALLDRSVSLAPGCRGIVNAGVIVRILPHATSAHLRDMGNALAAAAEGKP